MGFNKITLEHDIDISVVEYESLDSGSFTQFTECTWNELVNRLQVPKINQNKYSRNTAIYGDVSDAIDKYGNQKQKYRQDKNIINRNVIVLDYDDINDLKGLHNSIKERLSDVSWFWHTTFSHTTDAPRIRLLVPLSEPINVEEYRICSKVVANKIGHKVDEGSYQPSRCMALPVKKNKESVYLYRYNDARILDKSTLAKWYQSTDTDDKSGYIKYKKRDSSYWRDIAFGVSEGERNQSLASISGYLLRRYVDENLIYGLVTAWAQTCNPPINQGEVNKTFKSILKKHYNN
ncbi:primase alpha helix C-terminal domain-containing protein [Staphylococcus sp. HKU1]|uniref:primase alpha helix C-terminal domain-containing protein n=1 Tax=Staphylococcus sp. HKU1 TaxID=3068989 RepID=UPI003AAB4BF9